jgi:hypothetical protein
MLGEFLKTSKLTAAGEDGPEPCYVSNMGLSRDVHGMAVLPMYSVTLHKYAGSLEIYSPVCKIRPICLASVILIASVL